MGVLALKLVELAVVPGGGASERGHILDQDHPSPKHIEIHRVPLQRGGSQVVEGLGDERHLASRASSLEAAGISTCDCIQPLGHLTPFMGVKWLQETDLLLTDIALHNFQVVGL